MSSQALVYEAFPAPIAFAVRTLRRLYAHPRKTTAAGGTRDDLAGDRLEDLGELDVDLAHAPAVTATESEKGVHAPLGRFELLGVEESFNQCAVMCRMSSLI